MIARRLALVGSALLLTGLLAGCDPPQPWGNTQLVSVNAAGDDGGNGTSQSVVSSVDGTKLAFQSDASNLVPGDANGAIDVFVRDLTTGRTTLVSVNAGGTGSGDDYSYRPVISPDGSKIIFYSEADDLVVGCPAIEGSHWYVRDLTTGTTSLVTANRAEGCVGDVVWSPPVFSRDGTKVAFASPFPYMGGSDGPMDVNERTDVFVQDLVAGTTTVVSVNAAGTATGNGSSNEPAFSPDGMNIAFTSGATDLGSGGGLGGGIYVRDLAGETTMLVSARPDGSSSQTGGSGAPSYSPDGTKIAFVSDATDLGPADVNDICTSDQGVIESPCADVYLRDLSTGATSLASVDASGTDGADYSRRPVFSPDGRQLAFETQAGTFGPRDGNTCPNERVGSVPCVDIYLYDLEQRSTSLVSANAAGTGTGNGESRGPVFDPADGRRIAFTSYADDLGPRDANSLPDVYVRDVVTGTTTLVSVSADGIESANGASVGPAFATAGPGGRRTVAFTSSVADFGPTDTNGRGDVYLSRVTGADLAIGAGWPPTVRSGEQLTYRLDLSNRGPDGAATRAGLMLPEGTTFLSVEARGLSCAEPTAEAPRLVICTAPLSAGSGAGPVFATARVDAPADARITAVAAISSDEVDPHPNDNTVLATTTVTP